MTPPKKQKPRSCNHGRNHKLTIQLISALLLILIGSGLLITGFIVPPMGEIHPSVLIAFGETLTFVGALFGIDYKYKYKSRENGSN